MLNLFQIESLTSFIEENIRASEVSGIVFIDPQSFKKRLQNKQNHVIFGRRGAGKTTLSRTLKSRKGDKTILIFINMEDQKDKTFANILLSVIIQLLEQLKKSVKEKTRWFSWKRIYRRKIISKIEKKILKVKEQLSSPEIYNLQETNIGTNEENSSAEVKNPQFVLGGSFKHRQEKKVLMEGEVEKVNEVLSVSQGLKKLLKDCITKLQLESIFMVLDDFYFVRKDIQPAIIDWFHRISKDLNLYLKVATIKNRTNLYKAYNNSFYGVEIGNDIHEINLDYTLNEFQSLYDFLKQIIKKVFEEVDPKLSSEDIFTNDAFIQLCLASGGVPRDFLHLVNSLLTNYDLYTIPFKRKNVIDAAVRNIYTKKISLIKDTIGREDILDIFINYIVDTVFNNSHTNLFLIPLIEIEMYPEIKEMINDLVDLKMIHLVSSLIRLKGAERYACYMIDVGLYILPLNPKFNEKRPKVAGEMLKFQKSDLRTSPIILLPNLMEYIGNQKKSHS